MNIYEKLIEVRKSVQYLKKDNKGYQFQFVSSSQTLGSLRAKMDEVGLLLVPHVLSTEVQEHTTAKGGKEFFTELHIKYEWINAEKPEEKIICEWYGQGLDTGEKGVGKALTYAEKYFMLKFFNIATDKDDPDAFQEKTESQNKTAKKPLPKQGAAKPKASPELMQLKGSMMKIALGDKVIASEQWEKLTNGQDFDTLPEEKKVAIRNHVAAALVGKVAA